MVRADSFEVNKTHDRVQPCQESESEVVFSVARLKGGKMTIRYE